MTWEEYSLARQLLVEERIGTHLRQVKQLEDEKFKRNAKAYQRLQGA